MRERLFAGLDVGGTTMKAGVVDDSGRLLSQVSSPTHPERGQDQGLATMAECIRKAVAAAQVTMDRISAIGVATPGSMDIPAGLILEPPNLKPWRNVPVKQFIAETFQLPTAFQNDANAAAYGEYWIGAGRGCRSLVLFTLGTGIGGGIIIENQILEGAHSHGGELGHTKIDVHNGRSCGCGQRGCLESYASATAVVQRTREALASDSGKSRLHFLSEPMTARDVFLAAEQGDDLARTIVDRTAFYLAVGAANVMHTINPEIVCFGGGMIAAGPAFLKRIQDYVKDLVFAVPAARTKIQFAELGADAGVIGAANCGRQLVS